MKLEFITALRQNHALEHATVAVLISRMGHRIKITGMSTPFGFFLYGDIPIETIEESANEGLSRLQKGEEELAVSPFCGTNLAVAGTLAGIAVLLATRNKKGRQKVSQAIQAATMAIFLAQPLGHLVQKRLTTSASLDNVRIAQITSKGNGKRSLYIIKTTRN